MLVALPVFEENRPDFLFPSGAPAAPLILTCTSLDSEPRVQGTRKHSSFSELVFPVVRRGKGSRGSK